MAQATSSWPPEPSSRARYVDPAPPDEADRGESDSGTSGRGRALSQRSIDVTLDQQEDCVVVRVSGEVDSRTAPQLSAAIHRQLDAGTCRRVVVDLRGVEFIGAQGVMVLENARQHAEEDLIALETAVTYYGQQRFLAMTHQLARERRLSRFVFLARRPE